MKILKTKRLCGLFALLLCLSSCDNVEESYEWAYAYLGQTDDACTFFSQGDVSLCVDEHFQLYNLGADKVEFAFVKDLVYRIQMINKIPNDGWSETVEHINLQDGYVGRLLLDDGTYEYSRFYVYNIGFDSHADQYVLFKYQSNFEGK